MLYKNKKGVELFLPILVIITFFLLSLTAYTISKANIKLGTDAPVGDSAYKIFNIIDEQQKAQLYIDFSVKLAFEDSLTTLGENGGFSQINECQKVKPPSIGIVNEYNIFHTCKTPNIEESFLEILNETSHQYLKNYKSKFSISETADELLNLDLIYSDPIKENSIISFNENIIEFKPVKYVIPSNLNLFHSYHEFTPKVKLSPPDISAYKKLHQILFICTSSEDCKTKIKTTFPESEILEFPNDSLIYITIKQDPNIYLALDTLSLQ